MDSTARLMLPPSCARMLQPLKLSNSIVRGEGNASVVNQDEGQDCVVNQDEGRQAGVVNQDEGR